MRTRIKIVGATASAVFSLASVFTATWAWFASQNDVTATGMQIGIKVSGTADLESIKLLKFDFDSETIGSMQVLDYLNPANGSVNEYYYNEEYDSGAGAFGYDDNGDFVAIDAVMNVYDPVDRIIRGGDLTSLNCNAIYEISFTSTMASANLQLHANLLQKTPSSNQILLSDCADFDVYYEEDFDICDDTYSSSSTYASGDFTIYNGFIYKSNTAINSAEAFTAEHWDEVPVYSSSATYSVGDSVIYSGALYTCSTAVSSSESFAKSRWTIVNTYSSSSTYAVDSFVIYNGHPYICSTAVTSSQSFDAAKWNALLCEKIYYPSYKTSSLDANEERYYKLSYLSSLEASHDNFYSSNPKPSSITLENEHSISFSNSTEIKTVYINVNYAPSQADVYIREIYNTIRAIYDFYFDFAFIDNSGAGA